jgi:biopolymer transport protein ExbD
MAHKHKAPSGLDLNLNVVITPMLDMAFQMLAFFILTFQPSQLEGALDLNLPTTGEAKAETPQEADPSSPDTALAKEADIKVAVTTPRGDGAGEIGQISVYDRLTATETPIPGKSVTEMLENLREHLQKAIPKLNNKEDIKFEADSKLHHVHVVEVMDACTQAGFQHVSFAPPPDKAS